MKKVENIFNNVFDPVELKIFNYFYNLHSYNNEIQAFSFFFANNINNLNALKKEKDKIMGFLLNELKVPLNVELDKILPQHVEKINKYFNLRGEDTQKELGYTTSFLPHHKEKWLEICGYMRGIQKIASKYPPRIIHKAYFSQIEGRKKESTKLVDLFYQEEVNKFDEFLRNEWEFFKEILSINWLLECGVKALMREKILNKKDERYIKTFITKMKKLNNNITLLFITGDDLL